MFSPQNQYLKYEKMLGSIKGEAIASSAISEDINWGHNLQQSGGEGVLKRAWE